LRGRAASKSSSALSCRKRWKASSRLSSPGTAAEVTPDRRDRPRTASRSARSPGSSWRTTWQRAAEGARGADRRSAA
jgi:hypothetical protein